MAFAKMEEEVILGLDQDSEQAVRFVLKDGSYEHTVPLKIALLSQLVSGAVEMDKSNGDLSIPLESNNFSGRVQTPRVTSKKTVQFVVEYLRIHYEYELELKMKNEVAKKIVKPLISSDLVENGFSKQEADFIDRVYGSTRVDGSNIGRRMLCTLLCTANYMAILPLVELCSAKFASLMKGKPLEKIKELITPEAYTEND